MKIATFGYRGALSPYPSLEEEFKKLGHEIIYENPDLIFDLTGFYDDALELAKKYPKAKKIFNTLNADIKNPHWPETKTREQLLQADLVTSVSESTAKDVTARTGIEIKEIIYWPMKNVYPIKEITIRGIDFLYVGRLYSAEKRFGLIPEAIKLLKYDPNLLVVAGSERPPIGYYAGLINEETLNQLYNSSRYVFCPCWHEGSMSMLEAVVGGAFPIICNDNNWVQEFGLEDFAVDPMPKALAAKVIDIQQHQKEYRQIIDDLRPIIIEKFGLTNFAKRIIDLYNKL